MNCVTSTSVFRYVTCEQALGNCTANSARRPHAWRLPNFLLKGNYCQWTETWECVTDHVLCLQVVIVLTASPWRDQQSLDWLRSVRDARNRGIQIYSAGFGSSVRLPQLASIVRNPSRDAYIIRTFDDPTEPTQKLVNEFLRGGVSLPLLLFFLPLFFITMILVD